MFPLDTLIPFFVSHCRCVDTTTTLLKERREPAREEQGMEVVRDDGSMDYHPVRMQGIADCTAAGLEFAQT